MKNADEVVAQVQRDLGTGSQLSEQELVIKSVEGRNITLRFVKNCFRRHFSLPSKKNPQTDPMTKIEHKADMRFMAGTGATMGGEALKARLADTSFKLHGLSGQKARNKILDKYTSRADTLHVIDLSDGVHATMTEMALALVKQTTGTGWKVGTEVPVQFTFTKNRVVHITCSRNAAVASKIEHAHKTGNSVTFAVLRNAEDVFTFDHVQG